MDAGGIAVGFGAALFLALSYVFSGLSVRRYKEVGTLGLLCRAHVIMGVLSLVGLCFVYSPAVIAGFNRYWLVLLGADLFYLVGQSGLFLAQRSVDSSRVVPLLGLKLIILALINMFLLPLVLSVDGERYTFFQWLGIAVTLASAFMLNHAGGRIPFKGFLWIVLTCTGYALSDTCIKQLMTTMSEVGSAIGDASLKDVTRVSLLCAFLSYILSGIISCCLLPWCRLAPETPALSVWGWISPFAIFWLVAMLFLFTCFNRLGTVNGNIIQSTRGIIAILLGWLLSRLGFTELESKITVNVFLRRLFAGMMMILAIVLFNWKA